MNNDGGLAVVTSFLDKAPPWRVLHLECADPPSMASSVVEVAQRRGRRVLRVDCDVEDSAEQVLSKLGDEVSRELRERPIPITSVGMTDAEAVIALVAPDYDAAIEGSTETSRLEENVVRGVRVLSRKDPTVLVLSAAADTSALENWLGAAIGLDTSRELYLIACSAKS